MADQLTGHEPTISPHMDTGTSNRFAKLRQDTYLNFGPSHLDCAIDGMDIEMAADALQVDVEEIWRRIRRGDLLARSQLGKVFVYTDHAQFEVDQDRFSALPDLPFQKLQGARHERLAGNLGDHPGVDIQLWDPGVSTSLVSTDQSYQFDELIRLLNMAKEENREIIRLTSDSMSQLSQMTDEMLHLKDQVIEARELQVRNLEADVRGTREEIQKLRQEVEDLSTVAKFLDQIDP
jgi:hypothetical protein